MTVLVCIPCLLHGGTEVQTLSLIEALIAAGHRPVVACYFEHDDAMVGRYRKAGAEVRLLSATGKRTVGILATLNHLWRGLKQIVKAERPQVAHVQYMAPGALPIVILKMLGVRRIVATSHTGADIYGRNGLRVIRLLSRTCLSAFQCITLNAERGYFSAASLFNGKLKRHFTIYNSLPSHIEILTEPRHCHNSVITVGVVSRLADIKGMDLVIPAFNLAREKDSRLQLLIVGDGALRPLMEHQAEESPYRSHIEFAGRKPQGELQAWYDRIDILLMPSRSEGFGLTAIEGMARGCVPVVANVGGLPEVVTDECGYTHQAENVADMAERIIDATGDIDDKRSAALTRANKFARSRYHGAIQQLYDSLQ